MREMCIYFLFVTSAAWVRTEYSPFKEEGRSIPLCDRINCRWQIGLFDMHTGRTEKFGLKISKSKISGINFLDNGTLRVLIITLCSKLAKKKKS